MAKGSAGCGCQPVGVLEIADLLGVAHQTVKTWRHRDVMPAPQWTVSGQPAWDQSDILSWHRSRQRLRAARRRRPAKQNA